MPHLYVCPLSRLEETVVQSKASHVVTLINAGSAVTRPASIAENCHLFIALSDIVEPLEGHILPSSDHVNGLLNFIRIWNRDNALVFHCWAGISRSTAAAYITACALAPERDETQIAWDLRQASPTATPNARLIAIADEVLGRGGRMIAAIQAIGRGKEAMEGSPFMLKIVSLT